MLKLPWSPRRFAINRPPAYDALRTRGGAVVRSTGYTFFSGSVNADSRRRVTWGADGNYGRSIADDGWSSEGELLLVVKPRENLRLSIGPAYSRSVDKQQFVANIGDVTATPFAGVRSVFAELDQRIVQPFIANGRYGALSEYAAPRSNDVLRYGRDIGTVLEVRDPDGRLEAYQVDPDAAGPAAPFTVVNPDVNFRSLRGTAVVRWEYRPGSTLFFVWTQERSGSDSFGDFDFGRDRSALVRDRPVNVFQVKVSY
ncbi:MAG: hypothetical protein LH467_16010 [Gemmatimonadaceae bacterium]|nr:hypothetical protein [Gemmatimonadaceae bacterium]